MPASLEIAEALLAACLHADHKPGKIQFTKYLYLLDYCHWHFTGSKATSLAWKFYHFGPWCEEAETCLATLSNRYAFGWREEEAVILRSVEVATPPVGLTTKSLIEKIVAQFKDRDFNVLLDVTYSQTEPMVKAQRGDLLDFSTVPVTRTMPEFFPEPVPTSATYQVHPERLQKMEAFRARAETLKEKAKQRMQFRESEDYQQALGMVAEELGTYGKLPEIKGEITLEAANGLGAE